MRKEREIHDRIAFIRRPPALFAAAGSFLPSAKRGLRLKWPASEAECAALAELDGLVALRDLLVEAEASRRGKEGLYVKGRVTAIVTQTCVVTLEPFETAINETFEVEFAPQAEAEAAYARAMAEIEAAQDKAAVLAEQRDPPDPIINGRVDLGALAMEFLALGLDRLSAQPRRAFRRRRRAAEDRKISPFSGLARLKKD